MEGRARRAIRISLFNQQVPQAYRKAISALVLLQGLDKMADVVESLNSYAKEVFGTDGPKDLVPNQNKLQKEIPFKFKEAYGLKYVETIRLGYPSGFTHQAADGTGGAFTLNDATQGTRKRIEIQGEQILLKDQFSYEDGARIAKGGKRAFAAFQSEMFEPMQRSMRKRLETQLLYGASGLGKVETYTGGDPSIVITQATWAEGIWAGMEGAAIDIYDGASQKGTTINIVSVDLENRKLTLSGTVSGAGAGNDVYWDAAKGEEMSGVQKILENSTSLFGVDASVYTLWKASSKALSSAPLSFGAVKKVIAIAYNKGLDDDVCLFVSPESWDDMNTDLSALRRTDKNDVKKLDVGHNEMVYHSQNGQTKIVPSNFMKKGMAFGLCKKDWIRVGASDVTFNTPGMPSEKLFHNLETKAGIECRSYTNQGIFCRRPAASFIVTGIVHNS